VISAQSTTAKIRLLLTIETIPQAAGVIGLVKFALGRDTVWGPGLQQWDLGAAKRFAIAEQRYFQFRGEMFNTFNQVNFEPPVSTVGSAGFGTITSARPGRNVQLGLKFYW
jgi:hypothetical protein